MLVGDQLISLHTHKGVQMYQFTPDQQVSTTWGRELREVSQCQLTVPTPFAATQLPDIQPWLHWITVWADNAQDVLWRGPIQSVRANRSVLTISCRDVAAHYQRTRTPLTKRWDAADPAFIAEELWNKMLFDKGINVKPIVRPDPLGDRFDYAATYDAVMMEQNIQDLVQKGLRWTVVSGVPVLGPMPLKPVAALGENDFLGQGLSLLRDGAATFNDVVLRATDTISRGRVDIPGQNLQTIVNVDNMFGVSNADKAVRQYLREAGSIRDALIVPGDAELNPEAPVNISQLIPSARFTVEGYGLLALMELKSMQVASSSAGVKVTVNLESVNDDLPELTEIMQRGPTGL